MYQDLTALDTVLSVDVSGKNITEQAVVDEQTAAILEAINALEYKAADYTEYDKAVEQANAIDRSLYQNLTVLDEALAIDVSGKNITEQSAVDKQATAILEAINALEYKSADYTEYDKAVEQANALDKSLYQDLTALDNALAVDVSGKNITEQSVVDEQTAAILEAINTLEYKAADYTEYEKAVEQANAIDRSLYQDLTALDEVLAVDVSGKNITEQAIVDEQTTAILEAIGALVEVETTTEPAETTTQAEQESTTQAEPETETKTETNTTTASDETQESTTASDTQEDTTASDTQNGAKQKTDEKSPATGSGYRIKAPACAALFISSAILAAFCRKKKDDDRG